MEHLSLRHLLFHIDPNRFYDVFMKNFSEIELE